MVNKQKSDQDLSLFLTQAGVWLTFPSLPTNPWVNSNLDLTRSTFPFSLSQRRFGAFSLRSVAPGLFFFKEEEEEVEEEYEEEEEGEEEKEEEEKEKQEEEKEEVEEDKE